MSMYYVEYTKKAQKDIREIKRNPKLLISFCEIIKVIQEDPYRFVSGHKFEKIKQLGDNVYSRRLNIKDRVIYICTETEFQITLNRQIENYEGKITILSALGHPY